MRIYVDPRQHDVGVTGNLRDPAGSPDRLKSLCVELEASFMSILLSEMTRSVPGMFGGGFAGESYQQMALTQLSRHCSEAGGIGLADMLYRELIIKDDGGTDSVMSNQSESP